MKNQLYKEYIELDEQEKVIATRKAEVKKQITADMQENDLDQVDTAKGLFYTTTGKTWVHSDTFKAMEKEAKKIIKDFSDTKMKPIKELKKKEVEENIATYTENKSVSFREKKQELA